MATSKARGARAETSQAALRALARERTRVGLLLTAAVVTVYFSFIGAVAFAKPLLGWQITPGLSVGIACGAAVIVAAWALTSVYVYWANAIYDTTLRRLRRDDSHRDGA
jgi:uncharacterized membrane protein (DUF485 family)